MSNKKEYLEFEQYICGGLEASFAKENNLILRESIRFKILELREFCRAWWELQGKEYPEDMRGRNLY